jgi:putative ABC transport system ATP-binding protein
MVWILQLELEELSYPAVKSKG